MSPLCIGHALFVGIEFVNIILLYCYISVAALYEYILNNVFSLLLLLLFINLQRALWSN